MVKEQPKIKEVLECIKKLEDEGYINFKNNRTEIIDFLENDMQYIVFEKDGHIARYTGFKEACGKTIAQVKRLKAKNHPSALDQQYFLDNHLRLTWYNFICWERLGVIFLNKEDYRVINFHKDKKKAEEESP